MGGVALAAVAKNNAAETKKRILRVIYNFFIPLYVIGVKVDKMHKFSKYD
jgi:hypothetical protein